MKTHQLIQGTPEWDAYRLVHDNASEAAAMLGLDKKTTRTQLLHAKATGNEKEYSRYLQEVVFANGHDVEDMALPIIEEMIGEGLSPVTGSDDRLSASFDGITFNEDIVFEHKQWNEELAAKVRAGNVPDTHMPQLQQQLMVSRADKVIFVISDGTKEKLVCCEVLPDPAWFERIRAGWAQFHKDLAAYTPPVVVAEVVAAPVKELPAVVYEMNGMALTSNIAAEVKPAVIAQIERYARTPVTDQDFADLDAFAKDARASVKKSALMRETVMAKIVDVDKFNRELIELEDLLTQAAISAEKRYKAENENRKNEIRASGQKRYADHVDSLQAEIEGVLLTIPTPDFVAAGRGLKTLDSLKNAIDTCLANGIIAADAAAKDIRAKLAFYNAIATDHQFLFRDLQAVIQKPLEDFQLTVTSRIQAHKQAEADKLEAQRKQLEAEATAKAAREAAAKLEEERQRIRQEEQAKAQAEADARAKVDAEAKKQASQNNHPQGEAVMPGGARPALEQTEPAAPFVPALVPADNGKTIKLGEINAALGFTVTADLLVSLGFEFKTDKNAKLFRDCDFVPICQALSRHIAITEANYFLKDAA